MTRKCNNCAWEGEEARGIYHICPICGDNTAEIVSDIPVDVKADTNIFMATVDGDLNNDGKVDSKDATIAGKTLAKFSSNKRGKR